jgi:hypothetical protein
MDDQSTPHTLSPPSKRPSFGWLLWVPTIPLLYLLSTGPTYRLQQAGLVPHYVAEVAYAPLFGCLKNEDDYTTRAFLWYLRLWGVMRFHAFSAV